MKQKWFERRAGKFEHTTPLLSLCHAIFTGRSISGIPFLLWKNRDRGAGGAGSAPPQLCALKRKQIKIKKKDKWRISVSSLMPTHTEEQRLDKVCKVTWRNKSNTMILILSSIFNMKKITFNCQPSHFSPCSAVPEESQSLLSDSTASNLF